MSGFLQEPNYDFLKGLELTRLNVSRYIVDFVFGDDGRGINISSIVEHFDMATKTTIRYDVCAEQQRFTAHWLLGLRTTDTEIVSDDLLRLSFENGDTLGFVRMGDGYESMTIWGAGGVIVIY